MVGFVADPNMFEYYSAPGDAETEVGSDDCAAFSVEGLFAHGNPHQLILQAEAAAFIIIWNIIATFVILKIISFFIPLRASDGDVEGGDLAIHGIDPMPYYPLRLNQRAASNSKSRRAKTRRLLLFEKRVRSRRRR